MNKVIAIGALGGSGTRVIAGLMIESNIFMGEELHLSLDNLLEFVNIDLTESEKNNLYKIPTITNSFGRYKNHDINIFREDQIKFVEKMGFNI